jgi:hypothetical protein
MSRKFDPGYDEKREREIAELVETMKVMEMIEEEIETRRVEIETGDDEED